jgi:hypothetical protein
LPVVSKVTIRDNNTIDIRIGTNCVKCHLSLPNKAFQISTTRTKMPSEIKNLPLDAIENTRNDGLSGFSTSWLISPAGNGKQQDKFYFESKISNDSGSVVEDIDQSDFIADHANTPLKLFLIFRKRSYKDQEKISRARAIQLALMYELCDDKLEHLQKMQDFSTRKPGMPRFLPSLSTSEQGCLYQKHQENIKKTDKSNDIIPDIVYERELQSRMHLQSNEVASTTSHFGILSESCTLSPNIIRKKKVFLTINTDVYTDNKEKQVDLKTNKADLKTPGEETVANTVMETPSTCATCVDRGGVDHVNQIFYFC